MGGLKVVSISEMRPRLTALVDEVSAGEEPYFVASHSKVKAVLIGIDEYNALIERLEDLEDSLDILRARAGGESTRPLDDLLKDLGDAGQRDVCRRA